MRRRGCGINVIIEGLVVNRQGVITESPVEQVQNDIKGFLKERKISGTDRKKFYNLLTELYNLCNNAGPYKLIPGEVEFLKGEVDDMENPENPRISPSIYEYSYVIKFLSAVDVKSLYKSIYNTFKSLKSDYKELDIDSYAITVGFSKEDEDGLYLAIQKENRGLRVEVGYQSNVIESKTGVCGTEIGLPIDRENCESTDVGGVSTPTGGFSSKDDEKKKKRLIQIEEGEDISQNSNNKDLEAEKKSKEDDIERYTCLKCGSPNVNSDGDVVVCSDCGYSWDLVDRSDEMIDHMLPQEDDESVSDYQREHRDEFRDEKNEVDCLETQQPTVNQRESQ